MVEVKQNLYFKVYCLLLILLTTTRINIEMPVEQASKVVSMRPIIEQLVVKISNQPQLIGDPNLLTAEHERILSAVRSLARSDAGSHGVTNGGGDREQQSFGNNFSNNIQMANQRGGGGFQQTRG